jgi:hypothetical protein
LVAEEVLDLGPPGILVAGPEFAETVADVIRFKVDSFD